MEKYMQIEQVEQNGGRFLKALIEHIKVRADVEKLARALNYDPTQIETDIEDFVALMNEYRQQVT